MSFKYIELTNFRNYVEKRVDLEPIIYLQGDNGTGKTTLIESIFLLKTLKPFKSNFRDLINFNSSYFRIESLSDIESLNKIIYFFDTKSNILVNGCNILDNASFIHKSPVICYSPSFESILSSDQKERRKFIDRMIFYFNKQYLNLLKDYNLLLKRKKAILVTLNPNMDLLEIITDELIKLSEAISRSRVEFILEINRIIQSSKGLDFLINDSFLEIKISVLDKSCLKKEIETRKVHCGCHRDIFYLRDNKFNIEKFRSYGQMKSTLIVLLYFFFIYLKIKRKNSICLLLDDFEAGIDSNRISILSKLFLDSFSEDQIILTGITNNNFKNIKTTIL